MNIPSAIFFINYDISEQTEITLKSQLMIDEIMPDLEFDGRISADPNYSTFIHLNNLRIMIKSTTLQIQQETNIKYADVVFFVKHGEASVLLNKLGPPGITFEIDRINLFNLFNNDALSKYSINPNFYIKKLSRPLQDMLIDIFDPSHVHDANPDNIFNNPDFLARK